MNVLLTCAGRRNYLVDYFKEALEGQGKVYAVNSTPEATSMIVADGAFVAPPLYKDGYIDYLLTICKKYDIKLLVSLFDLELPVIAANKNQFEEIGVAVAVSSPEVINICNDKVRTVRFTENLNLQTLFTTVDPDEATRNIKKEEVTFPLYIKPRWGMGSIAMQQADSLEELKVLFEKVHRDLKDSYLKHYPKIDFDTSVVIQEQAKGQEYGLDIVNNFEGNYVTTFVKRKLAMRSGETDGAVTEYVPELHELGQKIGENLGHVGNLDTDVFWDGSQATILEMNARFGGGYPFSYLAGANLPQVYLNWVQEDTPNEKDLTVEDGIKGFKGLSMIGAQRMNVVGVQ
jgi:carbamoyl-phosphate synthase large subunit